MSENNQDKNLPTKDVLSEMIEQISELMTAITEMMSNFIEYVSSLMDGDEK